MRMYIMTELEDEIQKLIKHLNKISEYVTTLNKLSPNPTIVNSFLVQIKSINQQFDNGYNNFKL